MMDDRRTWLRWPGADKVGRAYWADLRVEGFEAHVEEARRPKLAYDRSMLHILHQFGIMSEAEVVSGSLLHVAHRGGRRDEAVREHMRNMFVNLRQHYHRVLVYGAEHGGEDNEDDHTDSSLPSRFPQRHPREPRQQLASPVSNEANRLDISLIRARAFAWYHVCYHPMEIDRVQEEAHNFGLVVAPIFLSFAWIGVDALCQHLMLE
ncbi:hypothetical protein CLOM_g2824 [Closterium sp. NIES-68]|nr:hypothetical protein CLOM_g2824 [Closterium sp. NIES-68]GJP71123.1 hypothetical protein CLOP_g1972 [Closterium sp. NIES-67]